MTNCDDRSSDRTRWRSVARAIAITTGIAAVVAGIASGAGEPSPVFVVISPMTQARANGTAALLPNGGVLIAGGQDSTSTALAAAEIYDPATGAFTFIGNMSIPRKLHTAVALKSGKVLIIGGIDAKGNILNSAELFDPVSLTFNLLNNTMSDGRAGHSTTLLPNGQVLIAGGQDATSSVNTAEIFDPASAQFTCVGGVGPTPPTCNPSMTDGRQGHTATLLNDGTVLLTGGKNGTGNIVASAERFTPAGAGNPSAGVFHSTGSMSDGRVNHTATLLDDGTVLVAGGADSAEVVPTAEIYNPATGSFVLAGNASAGQAIMVSPRENHTATKLSDGRVLLVGGIDNLNNLLATAEIYDPAAAAFALVANHLGLARASHTATLLGDGLILVAGGSAPSLSPLVTNDAELFDPAPGFFVPTGAMSVARQFSTTATLFNGPTLVVGGQNAFGAVRSTEIYDGATFSSGPPLSSPRSFHTVTLFPKFLNPSCVCNDQHVLFVGGVDNTGAVHSDADLYDSSLGLMLQGVPGGFQLNQMSHPRLGHTSTILLVSGMSLYTGGMTSDGSVLNNADLFSPATGSFTASAGTMVSSRVFHTATQLLDGTVLLAGGRDTNGNILNTAELYNPVADSFAVVPSLMTGPREFHTATALSTGQVLIIGGVDGNGAVATAEIYNPAAKTFIPVGRMSTARYFHSAIALPDGEVLVAGGKGNDNIVTGQAEIFSPLTASFRPAPNLMLTPRFGQVAAMLESGLVLLAGGDDSGFNATGSAELYDPPNGPESIGALVSTSEIARRIATPKSMVNAGRIQADNLSGSPERFSAVNVALSAPAIFSRLVLSARVIGKAKRPVESAVVKNPAATAAFIFDRPLEVPPGGSVQFTLSGVLGSLHRAGASRHTAVHSVQTATEIDVAGDSGSVQVQGLPVGFGVVTLR